MAFDVGMDRPGFPGSRALADGVGALSGRSAGQATASLRSANSRVHPPSEALSHRAAQVAARGRELSRTGGFPRIRSQCFHRAANYPQVARFTKLIISLAQLPETERKVAHLTGTTQTAHHEASPS